MAQISKFYNFYELETGNIWYPGFDQENMDTIENELSGLYKFVGPGVLSGWQVTSMALTGNSTTDNAIIDARNVLINAPIDSFMNQQYLSLNITNNSDENQWKQVIQVSIGKGIVGVYAAQTNYNYYFRLTSDNVYYVWAQDAFCLQTEGVASISVSTLDVPDYLSLTNATYLATVEVTTDSVTHLPAILSITQDSNYYNDLKNLAGALQAALKQTFYHHVHLGGANHPSKINLSSQLILNAVAPEGSDIFTIEDSSGNLFTWKTSNYGIPQVRLNNVELLKSDYSLVPSTGILYLKNSVPKNSTIQVILPLSPQVKLFIQDGSSLSSSNVPNWIYLTDGTTSTDSNGNTVQVTYKWSDALYLPAEVYLKGNLLNSNLYTIDSSNGRLMFNNPSEFNPALSTYQNSDLSIIITHIGIQITGKLSGKRVADIDASTFTRGTLDQKRIIGLDHVGQFRYKAPAYLKPSLRLLPEGDHVTFYPEIPNQALQYGTEVFNVYSSQNINPSVLLGTKRGLIQTSDYINTNYSLSWNIDNGQPIYFIDEILPADTYENHFHTTWALSNISNSNVVGKVWYTVDAGLSWHMLKMPILNNSNPFYATSFYASSQRDDVQETSTAKSNWSSNLYLGTNQGLFSINQQSGQTQNDWSWGAAFSNWYNESDNELSPEIIGTIYAIQEIVTVNQSTNSDTGEVTKSFNKTLYIGCDAGFFYGDSSYMKRITTDIPKGFRWNKENNSLLWWTDSYVAISNSSYYYNDGEGNTTWTNPFTGSFNTLTTTITVATVSSIDFTSTLPTIIDGVNLSAGNHVLVKNQYIDTTQNGIYLVNNDGTWTKTSDVLNNNTQPQVTVLNGTVNAGSVWYVEQRSDIIWKIKIFKLQSSQNDEIFTSMADHGTEYFAGTTQNIYYISEQFSVGAQPYVSQLSWNNTNQGKINSLIFRNNSQSSKGQLIAGTPRGLWIANLSLSNTTDNNSITIIAWTRTSYQFSSNNQKPTIYNNHDLSMVSWSDYNFSSIDYNTQAFIFNSSPRYGSTYVYEKDYTHFYTLPWNSADAQVIVYVNNIISTINYTLNPDLGLIIFNQSLSPSDAQNVSITVIRLGAYINNVGLTPHEELPNSLVAETIAATKLSTALTATSTTISVVNPRALPSETQYIQIVSSATSVRVPIYIDPLTYAITIVGPSPVVSTLPIGSQVFIVTPKTILGIEDKITQVQTNETYHFNSIANQNLLRFAMSMTNQYSNLYSNFYNPISVSGTKSSLGLVNTVLLNLDQAPSPLDPKATNSSFYVGWIPSAADTPVSPQTIYNIYNPSQSGDGMIVGTDQGVWIYQNNTWNKQSILGGAARTYFFKHYTNGLGNPLMVGTDNGAWLQTGNEWSSDPTYSQVIFDYLSGNWNTSDANGNSTISGTFEAFGKDDGLAFIYTKTGSSTFISDHFDTVDGYRVYGVYHDTFIRLSTDSQGNTQQIPTDALYLCTEKGLYGTTFGSRGGTYSSLLTGREMFGNTISNGVKYYKIFRPLATPPATKTPIPFKILTSNGIYTVRNWRWCDPDPTQSDLLNFYVESHQLQGLSCNCYVQFTVSGTPGKSLTFIGTNKVIYRSFDESTSFEICEKIAGGDTAVYDLQHFSVTFLDTYVSSPTYNQIVTKDLILAGTELGLYYSIDYGDTWYRSDEPTLEGYVPINYASKITSVIPFDDGYLAETFKTSTGLKKIYKISIYVSLKDHYLNSTSQANSQNNYLTAAIYSTDSNGYPTNTTIGMTQLDIDTLITEGYLPAGWTTTSQDQLLASDVQYEGFYSLNVAANLPDDTSTYALVIKENVASGAEPCFNWQVSALSHPYSDGLALTGGITPNWATLTPGDKNFFFKVFMVQPVTTTTVYEPVGYKDNTLPVGFLTGESYGSVVVTDDGSLTTDSKFAIALTIDDSNSIKWSDSIDGITSNLYHVENIQNLIDMLFNRTKTQVNGSDFYPTFADWWQYGTSSLERTDGFSNVLSSFDTYALALRENGVYSYLYDTANLSASGISPEAIVNAIINKNYNESQIQFIVNEIVQYHIDRNMLRLNDIQDWYETQFISDWDGTSGGIAASPTVRNYLIQRWANTFTPLFFVFADGDDNGMNAQTASQVGLTAFTSWNGLGANTSIFALDRSSNLTGLRTITDETNGNLFDINSANASTDWSNAINSLLHGGVNDVFTATWNKNYDFEEGIWLENVNATFSAPTGTISNSSCIIKVRWTQDRLNWSGWQTLTSGTPLTVQALVLGIQYVINMTDGWTLISGIYSAVKPIITELYHTQILPSYEYLITYPYDINGLLFEEILTIEAVIPKTAKLNWGICRGDITDFNYYEHIINGRNGVLPNRQVSLLFTKEIDRLNLATIAAPGGTTTDGVLIYQVIDSSGNPVTWSTTDEVSVYIQGYSKPIDNTNGVYALDGAHGYIIFRQAQSFSAVFTVNIITPAKLYENAGENTVTYDNRTYYLINGKWPVDSEIVVLLNNSIVRGNYFANNENGTITFKKELERTDVVTVYIQPSSKFRIGVEIVNYSDVPVDIKNFGLMYTTQNSTNLQQLLSQSDPPYISGFVTLQPSPASIYDQIYINYIYASHTGNEERNTQTTWWLKRTGLSGAINDGNGFVQITAGNGLPEYNNRTVERLDDIGSLFQLHDQLYVIVTPCDGYNLGDPVVSNTITLGAKYKPYVTNVAITSPNQTTVNNVVYVPANTELTASYIYNDGNGGGDQNISGIANNNIIYWYSKDSNLPLNSNDPVDGVYTAILPANMVKSGMVINYIITPYNGTLYGNPISSGYVTVQ